MSYYSINQPLLASEPSNKKEVNTQHIHIPNADKLRESDVYVTLSAIDILSTTDSTNTKKVNIPCDTIILINNDNIRGYIQVFLPIPGWIQTSTKRTSLIKINEHKAVILNEETLLERFREKEANEYKCIKKIILYFRKRPRLLHLLVLIILGFLELFVVIDIYFDVEVAIEFYKAKERIWFAISCILITAPYYVAWAVLFQFIQNKVFLTSFNENKKCKQFYYKYILFPVFLCSPLGVIILILYDFYHTFECAVLKPLWFGSTGRKLRTESYQELGYKKLRSVSEIFAETICQSLLYLWIIYRTEDGVYQGEELKIDLNKVLMSFGSSLFSLIVYGVILYIEASQNGVSLIEYLCVVMTGSFNFVPYLPAIERGRESGESVNWIYYKFTNVNIGNIGMAFNSSKAQCSIIKISDYTIHKMHREAASFFGKILSSNDVELIYSWRESHIKDWFQIFDVDESGSFEFEEFARLIVSMHCINQLYSYHNGLHMKHNMIYSYNYCIDTVSVHEFIGLFNILASKSQTKSNSKSKKNKDIFCIWMLDVLLMTQSCKEWIPVLDHYKPLNYAVRTDHIILMTLLSSYDYAEKAIENELEFEKAIKEAIVYGKYKLAMILCQHKGVPLLIHMDDITFKQKQYINRSVYITVSCINCLEYKSRIMRLNPMEKTMVFDDYVLFIVPFSIVDGIRKRKYNSLEFRINYINEDEEEKCVGYLETVFIDKISINLNEYRQIYKRQGWFNSLRENQQINYNTFGNKSYIEQSDDDDDDDDDDEEYAMGRLIFDETRYRVVITNENDETDDENDAFCLRYSVYLSVFNIYEKFGLRYIDCDLNELEALESIHEIDKLGDNIAHYGGRRQKSEVQHESEPYTIIKCEM